MLDVHAIADDFRAVPITSWSVFVVASRQRLAGITAEGDGRFRLETVTGQVSTHGGLREARDAAARAFTPPARVN